MLDDSILRMSTYIYIYTNKYVYIYRYELVSCIFTGKPVGVSWFLFCFQNITSKSTVNQRSHWDDIPIQPPSQRLEQSLAVPSHENTTIVTQRIETTIQQ